MDSLFDISRISFAHPQFFALLLIIPILLFWKLRNKTKRPSMIVSSLEKLEHISSPRARLRPLLFWLRVASIFFIIIALARPQSSSSNESIDGEGIDIVLSLDISGSMLAEDFEPNRIEAAKQAAKEFIEQRLSDRIGLVIFSGESFTQCPLTTDKNILFAHLENIRSGDLTDGTAIGMGLATAVNRLRESEAKSKIIILLTDGVNNSGLIDPSTALEIAKSYKTRVYTIGVGTEGEAPYPVQDAYGRTNIQQMPVQIDEKLLKKISKETGGKYFRADDGKKLESIYQEIDKLEKSDVEISSYRRYTEKFFPFAFLGLGLLFLELLLRYTVLRSFP